MKRDKEIIGAIRSASGAKQPQALEADVLLAILEVLLDIRRQLASVIHSEGE